jgi:2-polyprenyl-6-hydroxyphenyl methylase/3-demethylubiquinone-9 3-methyltransferase
VTKKKLKQPVKNSTVNEKEIRQFDVLGEKWWDENGPMKPLHRLNPTRLDYLRRVICAHNDRTPDRLRALQGLSIADIGCGGGLVTEPLHRMGAEVTGIDAGAENIKVSKAHAQKQGLDIDYRAVTAEELAASGEKYDVVTALEIIEHVDDVDLFVESCCDLVKKNGMIVFSTLNRTPKSYLLGIIAAEHILRWLPRGTHDWKKFVKPSEIARRLEKHGFTVTDVQGLVFNPLTRKFSMSTSDLDVNYFLTAIRK